jgi:hypothetical protein
MRSAAAASDTVSNKLPLMGLPWKALWLWPGECGWVMRSPCGEWCSITVIRPCDAYVHILEHELSGGDNACR